MPRPLITLSTDFGSGSAYVAQMKGVILSINPEVEVVDITHDIPPQEVRQGALSLAEATPRFPAGTIHVAVVDPGVGTERAIIYAKFGEQQYIAPDNGLLSALARQGAPDRIIALTDRKYWLAEVSPTFHGRDIMAPAAAHLSLGVAGEDLGRPQAQLVLLDWPEVKIVPGKIEGQIQSVDSFGNLVTDISAAALCDVPTGEETIITCDEHETRGIFETYADQPGMTLLALVGSSGFLELAIVGDSAKIMLGVDVGAPVAVTW